MVLFPEHHHPPQADPISIDPDPQLVELDARLGETARSQSVPSGLSERIFEASVGLLPAPAVYRFSDRLVIKHTRWTRAAMAACIALAALVGSWFMTGPLQHHPLEPAPVPHLALVEHKPVPPELEPIEELSAYAESVLFDDIDYLTHTHDVTIDDLESEIDRLLAHNDI